MSGTGSPPPGLALCFTPGVSVADWRRAGFLAREVRYYRELARCVGAVAFVSQGALDAALAPDIEPIALVHNGGGLAAPLFWATAPFRLARLRPRRTILKTNQLAGVVAPLVAKCLLGMRIVARGGYVASEPWRHRSHFALRRAVETLREALLCWLADMVVVTSAAAADYLRARYRLRGEKVVVIPNFVEVERFAVEKPKIRGLVCTVGRLTAEKNLFAAIEAIAGVPGARFRVVGDGPLRARLEAHAAARGLDAEFLGIVTHDRLPALLAESDVYLIASRFEGHPKSLLEAMAAGLPCVGAPSPGILPLIEHGVTGCLADDASAEALRRAVALVLGDATLRARLGRAARERVRAAYALERVLALECEAYRAAGWVPRDG